MLSYQLAFLSDYLSKAASVISENAYKLGTYEGNEGMITFKVS